MLSIQIWGFHTKQVKEENIQVGYGYYYYLDLSFLTSGNLDSKTQECPLLYYGLFLPLEVDPGV